MCWGAITALWMFGTLVCWMYQDANFAQEWVDIRYKTFFGLVGAVAVLAVYGVTVGVSRLVRWLRAS